MQAGQAYGELKYPQSPLICTPPKKPKNILILMIDTWRFDMLNSSVVPNIYQFSREAQVFQNHLSGGNSTRAGVFSLFYGLPATYWTAMESSNTSPVLMELLQKNHYQMGIYASAPLNLPEFNKTVFAHIPDLQIKTKGENVVDRDKKITQQFLAFLKNKNPQKPFFGFLFYDSAHSYCSANKVKKQFLPAASVCERQTAIKNIQLYVNRYKNALYFIDGQIQMVWTKCKNKAYFKIR